jgi:hypothetical protein
MVFAAGVVIRVALRRELFMLSLMVHRVYCRTLGYLFAASIAGAPLPSRPAVGTPGSPEPAAAVVVSESRELAGTPAAEAIVPADGVVVGPVDVAPRGWRKTTRGWERAEDWGNVVAATNAERLQQILDRQLMAERATLPTRWLGGLFAAVRRIDPITLVSLQIAAVSLFMAMVYHRDSQRQKVSCGSREADVCG